MQTLLFMAVIYLGIVLFYNSKNAQTPGKTTQQLYTEFTTAAKRRMNDAVNTTKQAYEAGLNTDLQNKKLTQKEFDEKKMEAEVIAAHTEYRAAKFLYNSSGYNIITTAYTNLKGLEKKNISNPLWTQTFKVFPDKNVPQTETTPKQLLEDVTKFSSVMGKETPVWGFFPGYQLVDFLVRMTGSVPWFSYAFAALLMAIFVRATVYKLYEKQLLWGRQMSQLQPLMKELRDKFEGQELQTRTMALYKEYGLNPMAGCLPVLIQMPFFFLIYGCMLHYRFEFEKGTFLWIGSGLSDQYFGFLARNLGERDYPLIVIYAISMVITTYLQPVSDPSNMKQQRMMGVSMSVMFGVMMFFWPIPSAFVLYWIFLNILATAQSLRAYRMPPPPLVKVNAPGGGVFPTEPKHGTRFGSTGAPKVHRPKRKK